jgi:hypothetical protein
MIDSARCVQRNGDPERAASRAEAVLADFEVLLDGFEVDAPFDEHVIALEYLLAAVELIIQVRGSSTELDALRERTRRVLGRSVAD